MTSMDSLFEQGRQQHARAQAPLPERMRPRNFDEFVGQEHILGSERMLRRAIAADRLPSLILWGPPGSGKTSLARLIAGVTNAHFEPVSAVTSGMADLRRIVAEARERQAMYRQRTILFVDEIHRFNKAQQDVILPHVEDGIGDEALVHLVNIADGDARIALNALETAACTVTPDDSGQRAIEPTHVALEPLDFIARLAEGFPDPG